MTGAETTAGAARQAARAAAGARPHLPRGRLPAGRRPDGPGPGRRQRRRAAAGRPPGHPRQPGRPGRSASRIMARAGPVDAVVAADTPMLVLAAAVAARMGLPHNPPDAVLERHRARHGSGSVGKPPACAQPRFEIVPAPAPDDAIRQAADAVGFPCVVKAVSLSASQGILRAGNAADAVTAARRIRHILAAAGAPRNRAAPRRGVPARPGAEHRRPADRRQPDRPPPSSTSPPRRTGPRSRKPCSSPPPGCPARSWPQRSAPPEQAARALGLTTGPVHAELRITRHGGQARPAMLELAARSHRRPVLPGAALPRRPDPGRARPGQRPRPARPAAGQRPGRPCRRVHAPRVPAGHAARGPRPRRRPRRARDHRPDHHHPARPAGLPLPDGDQYLGFIFAEAGTRQEVEQALTAARDQLRVIID